MNRAISSIVMALCLVSRLAEAAPASASPAAPTALANKAKAKSLVEHAQTDYKLGHFEDALKGYEGAYALFPAPALLFNLGQCNRNLKRHERAVFFFEGYLRDRRNSPDRPVIEKLLAEERHLLDAELKLAEQQRQAEERRKDEERKAQEAREASARLLGIPLGDGSTTSVVMTQKKPVYKKWWFWTAVGGVAVATVVGGTLGYYYTGSANIVPPSGSLGTVDRR